MSNCARGPRRQPDAPAEFGLKVGAFRPGRRWAVDNAGPGGYAHKLPPKERAWLERFNREYYDASFKGGRPLHRTKALRRDCYALQNASHRDIYARGMVDLAFDFIGRLERHSSHGTVEWGPETDNASKERHRGRGAMGDAARLKEHF